jgi:hypothetical protein
MRELGDASTCGKRVKKNAKRAEYRSNTYQSTPAAEHEIIFEGWAAGKKISQYN